MASTLVRIKRIYAPVAEGDGYRILVDRLWPRGVSKAAARIDLWMRDIAPSTVLRRWFNHDPAKWKEFRLRYHTELKEKLHSSPPSKNRPRAARSRWSILLKMNSAIRPSRSKICCSRNRLRFG